MSDVNLEFNVNPFEANLNVTTNDITFTPSAVNMTVFAGGIGTPAGGVSGNGQVQYNNNGILGGSNQFTYYAPSASLSIDGTFTAGQEIVAQQGTFSGNVSVANLNASYGVVANNLQVNGQSNLNSVGNVTILGGTSNQFLRTNGSGSLSWQTITLPTPGGTSNSVQYNNGGTLGGMSTVNWDQANTKLNLGSTTNIGITGGVNGYFLQTDGSGNLSWSVATAAGNGTVGGTNTTVQFNDGGNFAGNTNFTYNKTSSTLFARNITSDVLITANNFTATGTVTLGNISSNNITANTVTVNSTTSIQHAQERLTINATGPTGTINFDVLNQAVLYYTGNIAGNLVINVRGNGSTTFNSMTNIGDSTTIVLATTIGSSIYFPTQLRIDNSTTFVNLKWAGNVDPATAVINPNSITTYTYTVIKTGSITYTVLGSISGYQ
jgi:hypothetical protein